MDLVEKFREHAAEVPIRLPAAKRSEANTSQFLVMPFFEALGFSVHNPNDVEPEFTADVGIKREKVDFALKSGGEPVVLVEVKYAGATLDNQHAAQLRRYFSTKLDLRFGILTNGKEFRFFSDLERPNVMDDEPFMTLDFLNLDESLVDVLQLFTKARFQKDNALEAARTAKDRRRVRQVLKEEFDPLSHRTINFLLRIIQPGEIDESRRKELARLVKQAWQEFLRAQGASTESQTDVETIENDRNEQRVNPMPKPPSDTDISVFGYYDRHRFEAVMLRTSLANGFNGGSHCIQYNGRLTNAKEAMIAAIRTVDSAFYPGKKQYGLSFWKVIDPADDTERPLFLMSKHVIPDEALRQRVLDMP